MKIAVFDTHRFDRQALERANQQFGHELLFFEPRLDASTVSLAQNVDAVCPFVNDRLDAPTLQQLSQQGVKLITLRSAGFNNVDLTEAQRLGLRVTRVPEYSPYAVAEHAVALALTLNRKIHRAHARVREGNFTLDGLVGFDLHGKTVGLIGTGRIGLVAARIFNGFGCRVLAVDKKPPPDARDVEYVSLPELLRQSDIISLHLPLTPATRHLLDEEAFSLMKEGVMIINTGRGALIDTKALIDALKTGHVGAAGLDVYEEEEGVFFRDLSGLVLQDDVLARLTTFPNVLITSHQAFLTHEALGNIGQTTLQNARDFEEGRPLQNEVLPEQVIRG